MNDSGPESIAEAIQTTAQSIMDRGASLPPMFLSRRGARHLAVVSRLAAYIDRRGYSWWQLFWHRRHVERRRHVGWRRRLATVQGELWCRYRPSWLPTVSYRYVAQGFMGEEPDHTHVWTIYHQTQRASVSLRVRWYDATLVRRWNARGWWSVARWTSKHVPDDWMARTGRLGLAWQGYWRRAPGPLAVACTSAAIRLIERLAERSA